MAHVKMRKILLKDLNDVLTCTLCNGYLIDATSLTECHHVCCILRYFENCKTVCPSCNFVYKKKNQAFFKSDPQIQAVVYKVVPGLYSKETQRRDDFYRSTGVRASSSCSDDSVLERERHRIDEDTMASSPVGPKHEFFGPEDSISLSLEYYQLHLDQTPISAPKSQPQPPPIASESASEVAVPSNDTSDKPKLKSECDDTSDKRFLQCPAAVSMRHLQKFVRMKYALTQHHKVDIIYEGEVLPCHFSLMDVAYTFKWARSKPMRFFYRIFTPLKIQPIRIVNTASNGTKQLQVVLKKEPLKAEPEVKEEKPEDKESEEKERLLAHLQLQSKTKVQNQEVPEKAPVVQDCVFDYQEQDKEEIKRFAEIRDREWALQKKLDESREREEYHHFSKKRKKSKHKNECYKKRKLHAEITNKEEELKLKVKLTPHNGHKHKHHKSLQNSASEMSSKEKLLQMRQIRHKHVVSEDKNIQTVPSVSKEVSIEPKEEEKKESKEKQTNGVKIEETKKEEAKVKEVPKTIKEWTHRAPTVQIERNEQTEQQVKKTFLKSYQAYAEKYKNLEKNKPSAKVPPKPLIPISRPSNLERKIANLQQRCTIEAKDKAPEPEKKPISQYPAGFTVSKIETGVKRKADEEKRPSLEITLINPPTSESKVTTPTPTKPPTPTPAKRPPPDPIPLHRIKFLKSGLSIIPKTDKCDNIGALDLSAKPVKDGESSKVNGFAQKDGKNPMSNLQMLSKVAVEHSALNKNKPRPQMPNLQTLRIPSPNQRIPPSLKMIDKSQFRMMSPQIRNLRPNQNQSIRNIPNPSLLVRQQQQNRLNSLTPVNNNEKEKPEVAEAKAEVKEVSVSVS